MYNTLSFLFKKRIWIISYFDILMFFVVGGLSYMIDSFMFFIVLMVVQSLISNSLMWFFNWYPEPSQKEIDKQMDRRYSNNHWH